MRLRIAALAVAFLSAGAGAATLNVERELDDGPSFTAYLVSYRNAGLKLHALVAVPRTELPVDGFPVLVANHGYVPDPRQYGITAGGRDSRPGDYYRSIPELFTSRGFLVVMPDFRGHSDSEGYELIAEQDEDAMAAYGDDVIVLLNGLGEMDNADLNNVFVWGHSMGGVVSMHALLATDIVRASSFWSTMNVDNFMDRLGDLGGPVMIQHSKQDRSTEHANSARLAAALDTAEHPHFFHTYDGADHLFDRATREVAADRDAEFFRAHMQ
mgnify:CR=1 FL=1